MIFVLRSLENSKIENKDNHFENSEIKSQSDGNSGLRSTSKMWGIELGSRVKLGVSTFEGFTQV